MGTILFKMEAQDLHGGHLPNPASPDWNSEGVPARTQGCPIELSELVRETVLSNKAAMSHMSLLSS